jgi:GH24 family phage-related lysozyme (muramidase)
MVKSEPNEKKETSNMADFNFEEFSDVFEDTQEPIDFESLSDVVDVIGETIDTRARQSAMEAKFQETKPQAVDTFMDSLTERLISLEKFSPTAYKAVKDEKFLTYGYGHYGKDVKPNQKINKEEALDLLEKDILKRLPSIRSAIPSFDKLSEELRVEIAQSWFRGGMSGSPATIKLINQGKFKAAATEFLDNKEYLTAEQRGRSGIIPRMDAVANALKSEGTE